MDLENGLTTLLQIPRPEVKTPIPFNLFSMKELLEGDSAGGHVSLASLGQTTRSFPFELSWWFVSSEKNHDIV